MGKDLLMGWVCAECLQLGAESHAQGRMSPSLWQTTQGPLLKQKVHYVGLGFFFTLNSAPDGFGFFFACMEEGGFASVSWVRVRLVLI